LKLPLEILRSGPHPVTGTGETRNLSSGGVLFASDASLDIGQPIEYAIQLMSDAQGAKVFLRCLGKVLRRDKHAGPSGLVASLERYEFVREN
jgi:hypothetical protein